MAETFYSREEIKIVLNDAVANWVQPYIDGYDQLPVSEAKMIVDILIDALKDQFGIVSEPQQRLILSLAYVPASETQYPMLIVERSKTLKAAFAKRFPHAPRFSEGKPLFTESCDWKYFFTGATDEHVAWAKAAKDCGMIDAYIVDYDPS